VRRLTIAEGALRWSKARAQIRSTLCLLEDNYLDVLDFENEIEVVMQHVSLFPKMYYFVATETADDEADQTRLVRDPSQKFWDRNFYENRMRVNNPNL
jgi:hypothetical protein